MGRPLVTPVSCFCFLTFESVLGIRRLPFLLLGVRGSALRRAFSFCLNRCLRRSGRKRAASEAGRLAL